MVGVGLIGIGGYGKTHLDALEASEAKGTGKLMAAVIRTPGKYGETEESLRKRGVRIYRSHGEMLKREKNAIDLVVVVSGIDHHAEHSIDALKAGYHVVCEKPATGTREEARAMKQARDESGRHLAIAFQRIFSPAIQKIKEIKLRGDLGRLLEAKTYALWPRTHIYYERNNWAGRLKVGGRYIYDSVLQNAGGHYLQNMIYIAGESRHESGEPAEVYGESYRANRITSADTQFIRITTRTGCVITEIASHACDERHDPYTDYRFENGKIVWEFDGPTHLYTKQGNGYRLEEDWDNGDMNVRHLPVLATIDSIRNQVPPLSTIDNAMQHTMCIEAIFRDGVIPIPAEYLDEKILENHTNPSWAGSPTTYVKGIVPLVKRLFRQERSYHEAGLPWARPGITVPI